jgi:hypothetical protein
VLPFLDTYRTMCVAPEQDFRRLLEGVRDMGLAKLGDYDWVPLDSSG